MKKIVAVGLSVMLVFSLFGCAKPEPKPSETVTKVLNLLKTDVQSDFSPYFNGEFDNSDFVPTSNDESEMAKKLESTLIDRYTDFDFVILGETISEDKKTATVEVEFTTYDIGTLIISFITQYIAKAFELAFAGKSEDELNQAGIELLDTLSKDMKKDKVSRVSAKLSYVNGEWLIDAGEEKNREFFNGLTGGMIESIEKWAESMGEEE